MYLESKILFIKRPSGVVAFKVCCSFGLSPVRVQGTYSSVREGLVTPAEVRWPGDHKKHAGSQENIQVLAARQPMLLIVRPDRNQLSLVVEQD